jgi:soluble lytic murein transglycosylase-like protein
MCYHTDMSVTILPYIDEVNKTGSTITESTSTEARTDAVYDSFREVLASAERAQQAMAVDAILAAQSSGSISPETVQKLLGFNPAPNIPVAGSQNVSTIDTAAAVTSGSQASSAASTSGNTSSSSSTSLDAYFEEASEKYNVDVKLLKAIAHAESNFNPNATSSSGAMGVMQLMPSTAKSLGITDAYNAYDNIMGGAKVISQHLANYNGDVSLALAAYNAGSGNVAKYGGVPPFTETQNYIKKVLAYYEGA